MSAGQFLLFLMVVAGIGFGVIKVLEKKPEPAPVVVSVPTPEPTPVPVVAAPEPTPPQRRLSPPGTVYMIRYASIKIAGGVIGLEPGQRVTIMEDRGNSLIVSDGKYRGEIPVDSVTNDLDIAELAAHSDAVSQSRLNAQLSAYRAEADRYAASAATRDANAKSAIDAKRVQSSAVGGRDPFELSKEDKERNELARLRNERGAAPVARPYYVPSGERRVDPATGQLWNGPSR